MKKPNFFIVGAPKCGTTALSEYLKAHPNIFMSSPKEPHFFADEFRDVFYKCDSVNEYLKLFSRCSNKHKSIGEASVLYLYSEKAIEKIYEFDSNAKIIVMLRNPIDLVYSWHSQAVYNTDETELDFKKAWELQYERKKGINLSKKSRIPKALQYKEIASIGSQYEKLLSIFPKEQIFPILMEDFKKDTLNCYKNVLNFLNVEYDGRIEFPRINDNKRHKSRFLAQLERTKMLNIARKVKKNIGLEKRSFLKGIYEWNKVKVKRKPLNTSFRNELLIEFLPEIDKLEQILEVDLSYWKK